MVKQHSDSNMIYTYYVWDYWMRILPARVQSIQINELANAIFAAEKQPKRAVLTLNYYFWQLDYFFMLPRVGTTGPGPEIPELSPIKIPILCFKYQDMSGFKTKQLSRSRILLFLVP